MKKERERFERMVSCNTTTGCWLWTGCVNAKGYGKFKALREQLAHRASYRLYNGDIPAGLQIAHLCANPRCVNPAHLYAATPAQNTADMFRQGRAPARPCGEANPRAKLTEAKVRQIRKARGKLREIAARFGVCHRTVHVIRARKRWAHVED